MERRRWWWWWECNNAVAYLPLSYIPGIVGISPAWIPFNFWRSSIEKILLIHGTADTVHPLCLEMDNLG